MTRLKTVRSTRSIAIISLCLLCIAQAACGTSSAGEQAAATATNTALTTPTPVASTTPTLAGWHLVFDDEFTGRAVDRRRWSVANSLPGGYIGCCLAYAQQAWSPQNVAESGGQLHLITTNQPLAGYPFTSGAVTTDGTFKFKYGRLDINARLPHGKGFWPAFWLVPAGGQHRPSQYEVDLMETWTLNTHQVNIFFHYAGTGVGNCTHNGPDYASAFHVYSLIWTPDLLEVDIDGVKVCATSTHVPDVPLILILDTAVNGVAQHVDSTTPFPQSMDFDYVRVWQPDA